MFFKYKESLEVNRKRTTLETIHKRKEVVEEWLATPGIDFERNYVFIVEADFNFQICRTYEWPKKGTSVKQKPTKIEVFPLLFLGGGNFSRRCLGFVCQKTSNP